MKYPKAVRIEVAQPGEGFTEEEFDDIDYLFSCGEATDAKRHQGRGTADTGATKPKQ